MIDAKDHVILINSVEFDGDLRLIQGVLADPRRFVDFPDKEWEAWILGDHPEPVKVRLTTVESLVSHIPGAHPDGPPEVRDAHRRLSLCIAGVQNRLGLTVEAGPAEIPSPSFLVTNRTLRPTTHEVVLEWLLDSCAASADLQAWVAYSRWIDRMMAGDPDLGDLCQDSESTGRLIATARAMHATPGLFLPFEIPAGGGPAYGVIRLGEPKGPNLFAATLFLSDRGAELHPGLPLRRIVRYEEEGKFREFRSEIARIKSID